MVFPISKDGVTPSRKLRETQKKPTRSFKAALEKDKPVPERPKWSVFDFPKHKQGTPLKRKEKYREKSFSPHVHHQGESKIEMGIVNPEAEVSFLTELSPAMQDLVNKMEEYITLKSHNGVSTIELQVELNDKNSIFQGTNIRIEYYDTHPKSANILLSSPMQPAVDELTTHLPTLLKAMQTKLENFQIHLLPPAYLQLSSSKTHRKTVKSSKTEKGFNKKPQKIKRNPFLN